MTNTPPDAELPADADTQSSGFNPLQILARRWAFLAVGLVIGAGVGWLIYQTSPPIYQSYAQVLVVKKRTEMVKEGDVRVGAVEDYVATQVTLLKSEKIRLAAAAKARESAASGLPTDDRTLADLIGGGLTVSRDKDAVGSGVGSGVLNLSFRGSNSEHCRVLLDAVIRAHQAELYAIYEQAGNERKKALDKMLETITGHRKKAGEDRVEALKKLRNETTEEVAVIRTRVSAAREQIRTSDLELVDLADQLKLIADTGTDPQNRQLALAQLTARFKVPGGVGPVGGAEPAGGGLAAVLRGLERQKRDLMTVTGLGKDHPKVLAIDSQIADIKEEMGRIPAGNGPGAPDTPVLDELAAYGKFLEHKKKTLERQMDQVKKQLKADEEVLQKVGGLQDQIDALTAQVQQFDAEIKRMESELLTLGATQAGGSYTAEQITPPGNGSKIAPVLVRSMVTGLGLGAVLGVVMMLLAELSDKSFRSPLEIRKRLGLPVVAHVPFIRTQAPPEGDEAAVFDPVLISAMRPKSSEAEVYRALRTQLYFSTQGRGHQVIQVSSPSPGDGKSTLAANLAISIAQSGKRTVLIDCDFRKPRVHKLFAVTNEAGLAGIIAGVEALDDGLIESGIENLDLLPCGVRPANPAELLSSPQFQKVLGELRERYDFVIVDTPPLLAVSDPAIVAPRVDGVLVVFRMTKKVRPAAERAREVLTGVGANVLGVVVNASDQSARAYGYGYGYRYAYGYTYNYNYKYTNYSYSDSYDDHEEEGAAHRAG